MGLAKCPRQGRQERIDPDTPLFWSIWGRRGLGKVYGRPIGCPRLKPHDLRRGVAMEVLEQVRAVLGHARIDTTQVYASIRPPQLKRTVAFYEEQAVRMLSE